MGPLSHTKSKLFASVELKRDIVPVIIRLRAKGCCGGLRTENDAILNGPNVLVIGLDETDRVPDGYLSLVSVIRDCPIVPMIDTLALQQVLIMFVLLKSHLKFHSEISL